jgi:hypothetical protein
MSRIAVRRRDRFVRIDEIPARQDAITCAV